MYFMPGTPLIARSIVMMDDFTNTSALAPGNDSVTVTRGGAMSGNCDTGNDFIDRNPMNTINSDSDIAITGLLIKTPNIDEYESCLFGMELQI
jgi:hypothetical protein